MPATRPRFRLACCLCSRPIAARQDVYPLDDEWARRYPDMRGRLACSRCALGDRYYWDCRGRSNRYPPGHIRSGRPAPDIDAWSHVGPPCTHAAAVLAYPASAMVQGGAAYLRWAASSPRCAPRVRARLAAFLAQWDAGEVPQ